MKHDQSDQLIHIEKMAKLGEMVAEVAHEINTPSGAINAAIGNISQHLTRLVDNCTELQQQGVEPEHVQQILQIVTGMLTMLDEKTRKSSSDIRAEQKAILELLKQKQIQANRTIARDIARIGLTEQLDTFLELAARYGMEQMLSFFSNCNRIISAARDIQLSIDILTRFILALKSYSSPWQKTLELVDIHDSIDTALIILNNKLKHRIQVDYRKGELPEISCYASELSHVWLNLLHNAIQAIPEKGTITIETASNDRGISITISDTGTGIPEDIQSRIFDPKFTTKSKKEGTGLGLHLARQVVEKQGGTIRFTSRPGCTAFKVMLPFAPPKT